MAGYHTVKQGEHLAGIALAYGFLYRKIWDHPSNAELKAKRDNPSILFPGDQLFIPDRETKQADARTDKHHKFQLSNDPFNLRIKLEHGYSQPLANKPCSLIVEQETFDLTSDDS